MGKMRTAGLLGALALTVWMSAAAVYASDEDTAVQKTGGGYAVTGQIEGVGYTAKLYNAENGLPTSDANIILSASDGYIWIGGYSGLIRYDGNRFERQDSSGGLTNAKALFEDNAGRLWVGTNDNGVVVMDHGQTRHFTYRDGLPSSTIRAFAQSADGTVFIGTTGGVCYVDGAMNLYNLDDSQLRNEYILQMAAGADGTVYGNTKSGAVFCIEGSRVAAYYAGADLGIGNVTTIFADPDIPEEVYLGTDSSYIYYGSFADNFANLKKIAVAPASDINWITYASGRIWVISDGVIGYLDEKEVFHALENIPLNSAIETMTEDYQGNLWFTSSRQGVMKIVSSNFENLTELAGLEEEVVNSTCLYDGILYIGTDKGLQAVDEDGNAIQNALTDYIGDARIRCIAEDLDGNLWLSTYTNGLGLVRFTSEGGIRSYSEENGLVNNGTRCTLIAQDGSVLEGTNGGLVILKDGEITRTIGADSGLSNTIILTVAEDEDGRIYLGTDGDGIYIIEGSKVTKKGRDDGLTSDVILRIKKDEQRGVFWIITSNSIEYMRDGVISAVTDFPYSNNFDVFFDENDNLWVLSSYGIYCAKAADMLGSAPFDYQLYNTADGLPSVPTSNAFSAIDGEGNLYISGRSGVSRVNINHYFDQFGEIKVGVRSILCDEEELQADEDGTYTIPQAPGRIQINASVLNYKLSDPLIHIYLEGAKDEGITVTQSNLSALEFTGLPYGDYTLHIQIMDSTADAVYQDETFAVTKKPELLELVVVRVLLIALGMLLVGLFVWRFMSNTIIRRQYEQIRVAKEEAERANGAKSRFLANMSHEIRTPINTIMGMDEMILREDATDVPKAYHTAVAGYAVDIKNASESLLTLINDVLDLSKIESGKMHLVEQAYETEELLRSVVTMIRVRSEQKDLSLALEIDEALPKKLYGDVSKIKQIVLNLLTNAVKYTEVGGVTLNVTAEKKGEETCRLRFSVKDTGIGVKPEDMDKLFSAFERLDEERNSGIQGTGLGLDISRQFAALMGGDLTCESVYGEGSDFVLAVDQKILDETAIGVFKEHDDSVSEGVYVPQFCAPDAEVLVVDDNPMNLTVIKGLLKATEMFITTAASGEECLEKLKYGSFNVVLLDHMMPGMDGLETIKRIRETHPTLPVIALTANGATDGEEFYKAHGFDGYLGKPVDGTLLEKTIKSYLPPEILMEPAKDKAVTIPKELPEDLKWLHDVDGISVEQGIRYSGDADSFAVSLRLFYDSIDDNAEVIENTYREADIKLYTVKVHALKSSARIIGAAALAEMAQRLEDAGNQGDMDFIHAHHAQFLEDYRAYQEKLSGLKADQTGEAERPPIAEDELADAYQALREVIPQMDYDAVEMVLEQLHGYQLPQADAQRFQALEKMLKQLDWDGMEAWMEG